MKHFTAEECIDFVNQLVSSSREAEMAEHLNTGCERCAKAVSSWQRIRRAVAAEATYQPPKEAIRIAKAAFAGSEWARRRKPAKRAMEVLFDSFLRPAAAGIRSSAGAVSGSRRMLYRADPFRIDLQIEAQVGAKGLWLPDSCSTCVLRRLRVAKCRFWSRTCAVGLSRGKRTNSGSSAKKLRVAAIWSWCSLEPTTGR